MANSGILFEGSFYPFTKMRRDGSGNYTDIWTFPNGKKLVTTIYASNMIDFSKSQHVDALSIMKADLTTATSGKGEVALENLELTESCIFSIINTVQTGDTNASITSYVHVQNEFQAPRNYSLVSGGYGYRELLAVPVALYDNDELTGDYVDWGVLVCGQSSYYYDESNKEYGGLLYIGSCTGYDIPMYADKIVTPEDLVPDAGGDDGGIRDGVNPNIDITIPALPNIDISGTGNTLYTGANTLIRQFNNWLWSDDFITNLKKMYDSPSQAVLGFSVVDFIIPSTGSDSIHVGNLDTGIIANRCSPWQQLDCGWVKLYEVYGSYVDYAPFLSLEMYLPKIGVVQIDPDIMMNNELRVVYNFELLTGSGVCYLQIKNARNGVTSIYKYFPCTVCMNIPWSLQDRGQQINAVINAAANTVLSGGSSIIGGLVDIATATPSINVNGNLSGASNILGYKKPYLIIKRSHVTKPENYKKYVGYKFNTTTMLKNVSGFTTCENPQVSFECPEWVARKIEEKLASGIFI